MDAATVERPVEAPVIEDEPTVEELEEYVKECIGEVEDEACGLRCNLTDRDEDWKRDLKVSVWQLETYLIPQLREAVDELVGESE